MSAGGGTDPVLVVNAGSSTLKLAVVAGGGAVASALLEDWEAGEEGERAIAGFAAGHGLAAVGHRVVHGGSRFMAPVVVDDAVRGALAALTPLAPLHQPRSLAGLDAARRALPGVPHVACFDTAFHATMPAATSTYALPEAWRRRWGLRRFGFHGLSHAWAARRAAELLGRPAGELAVVTMHLGAGASLCAVAGGRSVDTTMGFTPLEGLVMATRSGTVDPGLVLWLLGQGLGVEEVADGLEHHSGLAGLGGTPDMREVLARRAAGDGAAGLAFDVYVHRACREALAMTAALGRLDAVAFTGGVGERSAEVRAAVAAGLAHTGLVLDEAANRAVDGDAVVGAGGHSAVGAVVVAAREDLQIAGEVRALVG